MTRWIQTLRAFTCAGALLGAAVAGAAYPDRPIKLIVPYTPAGVTDTLARALAEGLGRELAQPVIVENRPGGSTQIGTRAAARAAPDGYTLLLATNGNMVLTSLLYKNLNYDVQRDLEVFGIAAELPTVIVTNPQVPVSDLRQFGAYIKAHPDKANYASLGQSNVAFLASKMLETELGVRMTEVPYKGSAPALAGVLANDAQLLVDILSSSLPFIKAGKLKPLAVPNHERLEVLPEVPTLAEAGYAPFHAVSWVGLAVPRGTPRELVTALQRAMALVVGSAQFKQTFTAVGLSVLGPKATPEIESYLEADRKRWGEIIQRHQITVD